MFLMQDVTKVYRVGEQDFTALHGISLEIENGSFMSFVGPSGSGKTTILNLLGGLDSPTSGEVRFQGRALSSMSRDELAAFRRDHVGFIFQSYNLLPVYDVYENVLFPLLLMGKDENEVRQKVRDLVDRVGLSEQINKKPATLSGGQCQRVAIARALVKEPAVVLADEPTANLDAENSYHVLELMQKLNREIGAAFVFSTHDEKVTQYVRREIRLEDGYVKTDEVRQVGGEAA
ncbi:MULTISPECIES: ABC transporter ATP-binding protein [unclassified Nitrospina]|uniref:ABC transporter ATP-binding protein n=1 Tax=unclassified Nitrospina TaxID=2638683 RepID=UPI003F94C770